MQILAIYIQDIGKRKCPRKGSQKKRKLEHKLFGRFMHAFLTGHGVLHASHALFNVPIEQHPSVSILDLAWLAGQAGIG